MEKVGGIRETGLLAGRTSISRQKAERKQNKLVAFSGSTSSPLISPTSVLKRAIRTLWTVLDEMDLMWIPVTASYLKQRELHPVHAGWGDPGFGACMQPNRAGVGMKARSTS